MSELKTKLWAMGVSTEDLDSIVEEGASRLVSRINDEGMSEQLRFLEDKVGMSESDAEKKFEQYVRQVEDVQEVDF